MMTTVELHSRIKTYNVSVAITVLCGEKRETVLVLFNKIVEVAATVGCENRTAYLGSRKNKVRLAKQRASVF
jgi:hypothetical protein